MRITKVTFYLTGVLMNASVYAHDAHAMNTMVSSDHHMQSTPQLDNFAETETIQNDAAMDEQHRHEHGGQIYQATQWDNLWALNRHGEASISSELKSWIGTDENKLFLKAELEKEQSSSPDRYISVLYSRNIANFWDVQAGVRYRDQASQVESKEHLDAVFALHGLAPYFFETDVSLYLGEQQYASLKLETERDILLTQKLILKPYLEADIVLSDQSRDAEKKGLSTLKSGLQTRYEINKKVMPFIDLAYHYKHGQDAQEKTSEREWLYGAGMTFKF